MAKFIVELKNCITYEVEVEADDEYEAYKISDELMPDEDFDEEQIVNNCWDTTVWEKTDD